jgi:hypothetical protein
MPDNPAELRELFDPDRKIYRWVYMLAEVMADPGADGVDLQGRGPR